MKEISIPNKCERGELIDIKINDKSVILSDNTNFELYFVSDEEILINTFQVDLKNLEENQTFKFSYKMPTIIGNYKIVNKTHSSNLIKVGPEYSIHLEFGKNSKEEKQYVLKTTHKKILDNFNNDSLFIGIYDLSEKEIDCPIQMTYIHEDYENNYFETPSKAGNYEARIYLDEYLICKSNILQVEGISF